MITIAGKKLDESSKSARVEGYFKSLEKLAKYVLSHLLAHMFCQCLSICLPHPSWCTVSCVY